MNLVLETDRLRLREFTVNDTAFIIELLNSPGWLRFIGDRHVKTETDALRYLEEGPLKSYRENGFGLSMVERKEDHVPAGMCGLVKRNFLQHPDIGFAFLPRFEGRGYGFEMVSAVLTHACNQLHFTVIHGITMPENAGSIRLLEKSGFDFDKILSPPQSNEELKLYTFTCGNT